VPDEEPTGIDINAQEPCGTFAEVQRSEFANSAEPNLASQPSQMIDASRVGGHPSCPPLPVGQASTAPAKVSPPFARLPGLSGGSYEHEPPA
jgi:hypothetical protein